MTHKLENNYIKECPGVSIEGVGQQWPAAGSGALNTTDLGAAEHAGIKSI